jgi:predicted metal-dependent hydrolase
MDDCDEPLHPAAAEGIRLFNCGEFFEAHEALEEAWRAEAGPVRDLYRGILQIAVTYLHIARNNYAGAIKVYARAERWLRSWPETCRGVQVAELKKDAQRALEEVQRLGPEGLANFDPSFFKPIRF